MTGYRVLYLDTLTEAVHGELPVESFTYSHSLNEAGSFSATLPLESTVEARLTGGYARPELNETELNADGRTTIVVERDGVVIWAGIVWSMGASVSSNTLTLGAEGFLSYFSRRFMGGCSTYTATEQVDIGWGLLNEAQSVAHGSLGIIDASTATGVTRDRSYGQDNVPTKPYGEALQELADVENGFDFRIDTSWSGGALLKRFVTSYPKTGRPTSFVFELGSNVQLLDMDVDGSNIATTAYALGASPQSGTTPLVGKKIDTTKLGTVLPLLERVDTYSTVTRLATLNEHAGHNLTRTLNPLKTVTVMVLDGKLPKIGSYTVGDRVRVKGGHGWLYVDQDFRIVEVTVAVDDLGQETASLNLAPLEAFA